MFLTNFASSKHHVSFVFMVYYIVFRLGIKHMGLHCKGSNFGEKTSRLDSGACRSGFVNGAHAHTHTHIHPHPPLIPVPADQGLLIARTHTHTHLSLIHI